MSRNFRLLGAAQGSIEMDDIMCSRAFASRIPLILLLCAVVLFTSGCGGMVSRTRAEQTSAMKKAARKNAYQIDQIDTDFGNIEGLRQELIERVPPSPPSAARSTRHAELDLLPSGEQRISLSLREITLKQLVRIVNRAFKTSLSTDEAGSSLKTRGDVFVSDADLRSVVSLAMRVFDVQLMRSVDGDYTLTPVQVKAFYLDPNHQRSAVRSVVGGDLLGATKDATLKHEKQTTDAFGMNADPFESLVKAIEPMLQEDSEALKLSGRSKSILGVDKVRGIITVVGRPSQIASVEVMLANYQAIADRQIDIDAQIVELELNDSFQLGIDWARLGDQVAGVLGATQVSTAAVAKAYGKTLVPDVLQFSPAQAGAIASGGQTGGGGLIFGHGGLRATVNALRLFGEVQVVASPTVRLRSGTVSSLSVGDIIRYIQSVKTSSLAGTGGSSSGVSTEVVTESLFSGIYFSVGGRVNDQGAIDLFVAPSQNEVNEGSLALIEVGAAGRLSLPRVRSKSISNWISMKSGNIVVLGGLIDRSVTGQTSGVPGLAELPSPVSAAFGSNQRVARAKQILLVLRAVVVNPS